MVQGWFVSSIVEHAVLSGWPKVLGTALALAGMSKGRWLTLSAAVVHEPGSCAAAVRSLGMQADMLPALT